MDCSFDRGLAEFREISRFERPFLQFPCFCCSVFPVKVAFHHQCLRHLLSCACLLGTTLFECIIHIGRHAHKASARKQEPKARHAKNREKKRVAKNRAAQRKHGSILFFVPAASLPHCSSPTGTPPLPSPNFFVRHCLKWTAPRLQLLALFLTPSSGTRPRSGLLTHVIFSPARRFQPRSASLPRPFFPFWSRH